MVNKTTVPRLLDLHVTIINIQMAPLSLEKFKLHTKEDGYQRRILYCANMRSLP